MDSRFAKFQQLTYRLAKNSMLLLGSGSDRSKLPPVLSTDDSRDHPFEERNVHPLIPEVVKSLFDNGHYAQSTFEAFKYLDKVVQQISGSCKYGSKLMNEVFGGTPVILINNNQTETEKNEQKGYYFLFAGSVLAIRNPRGHEHSVEDSPEACLDHLGLASLLLRRLEDSGHSFQ